MRFVISLVRAVLVLLLVASPTAVAAQTGLSADAKAAIDRAVIEILAQSGAPSASIAVVQNDDDGCGAVGGFLDSGCGNPQAQYATCLLEKGDKTVDATGSYIQPNSGGQRWGVGDRNGPTGQPGIDSVPLQSVVELSHAGSLTLTCYSPIDNDWFGGNGRGWLALMDDSSIQAVRTG